MGFSYFISRIKSLFIPQKRLSMEEKIQNYRAYGIDIGVGCKIYSDLQLGPDGRDRSLVHIGNNVTISNNVKLLTHDNGIIKPTQGQYTDIIGTVVLQDDVFIGYGSIILPGVEIAKGCIIGAGSVVVKSIDKPNSVYGGNPARYLCSTDEYVANNYGKMVNLNDIDAAGLVELVGKNPQLLKKR